MDLSFLSIFWLTAISIVLIAWINMFFYFRKVNKYDAGIFALSQLERDIMRPLREDGFDTSKLDHVQIKEIFERLDAYINKYKAEYSNPQIFIKNLRAKAEQVIGVSLT